MTENPGNRENASGPAGGRRGPRGPEAFRTVLVYPTRDGDHIMITLQTGEFYFILNWILNSTFHFSF